MTIDLTQIILAVITLLFCLLMRYVIPMIKNGMDADKRELLLIAVKTAVYAAEKLYGSGQGQRKLQYVIDLLHQQGYVVDPHKVEDTTRALIEAMVKELEIETDQAGAFQIATADEAPLEVNDVDDLK